jgi:hypothetical protein
MMGEHKCKRMLNLKMRGRKLRSRVNWQGALKTRRRKPKAGCT